MRTRNFGICEGCGEPAATRCGHDNQPMLSFCERCYARHVRAVHNIDPFAEHPWKDMEERMNLSLHDEQGLHAVLHLVKAAAKLAMVYEEAAHRGPGALSAEEIQDLAKPMADVVICAARLAQVTGLETAASRKTERSTIPTPKNIQPKRSAKRSPKL